MPALIGTTRVVHEVIGLCNRFTFIGPAGCGKTRSALVRANEIYDALAHEVPCFDVFMIDPHRELRHVTGYSNPDNLSFGFCSSPNFLRKNAIIPEILDNNILVIDDGRGDMAFLEGEYLTSGTPKFILCTKQTMR